MFANAKKNEVPRIRTNANLSSTILGSYAIIIIPRNEIIISIHFLKETLSFRIKRLNRRPIGIAV